MSELEAFREHLEELRRRVLKIVIVVGAVTAALLTVHLEPVQYAGLDLYYPTVEPLNNVAAQITVYMKSALLPEEVQLIQTSPGQAFFSQVYIAALVGIMASMPITVRELVAFVSPALKEGEVKIGRTVTVPAVGLFAGGAIFAYLAVIPYILEFLYGYGKSAEVLEFLNVVDFVTFVLQFMLAFGFSFQLPLVMHAATASGMTDHRFWRRNIRYAVIAIVVFGAVITPDGTGVSMWLVAGPMIGLYLAGMGMIERNERKSRTLKS